MKFCLLLPTRGRPIMLKNALDSLGKTMSGENKIAVYLATDNDDKRTHQFLSKIPDYVFEIVELRGNWGYHVGKKFKTLYEGADGDIYMLATDDIIFMTEDWDRVISKKLEEYPDRIVMLWGYNMWGEKYINKSSNPFLPDRVCKTLGYFTWYESPFWYHETWINEIFGRVEQMTGERRRIPMKEVRIKNLHPYRFKEIKKDDTGRKGEAMLMKYKPGKLFRDKEHTDWRQRDAEKLAKIIEEEKEEKTK